MSTPPTPTPPVKEEPPRSFLLRVSELLGNTFDTKTALAGLYLWLLFGFLSSMVSCDIQRWMLSDPFFRHVVGIISFYFLFTIIDTNNKLHVTVIWAKTLFVYGIFLLMTKTKWMFALPVLVVLVIDQTLKAHVAYLHGQNEKPEVVHLWDNMRGQLNVILIVLVLAGFAHYVWRQKNEFGESFEWNKLFFSNKCNLDMQEVNPSYDMGPTHTYP